MIDTEKGIVKDFLVQLEIYEGEWRACIRYNYAHGRPYKDILYRDGRKRKEWIDVEDLSALIDAAPRDLRRNSINTLGRQAMKLSKEEKKRIGEEIELTFEAVKEMIKDPKKLEAMPKNSVLMPVKVKHTGVQA